MTEFHQGEVASLKTEMEELRKKMEEAVSRERELSREYIELLKGKIG